MCMWGGGFALLVWATYVLHVHSDATTYVAGRVKKGIIILCHSSLFSQRSVLLWVGSGQRHDYADM